LKDEENTMRAVTVYRMDYGRRIKDPVGVVIDIIILLLIIVFGGGGGYFWTRRR
jgi:hypothetical protein